MVSRMLLVVSICLSVYVSNSHLDRVPNPKEIDILPFDQNIEKSRNYATKICAGYWRFYNSDDKRKYANGKNAFIDVFGGPGKVWNKDVIGKDFGRLMYGYQDSKRESLMIRKLLTLYPLPDSDNPCKDLFDFDIGSDYIGFKLSTLYEISDMPALGKTIMTVMVRFEYEPSDGTIIRVFIDAEGQAELYLGHVMDVALTMSTTVYNAAAYLRLIEKDLNDEDNNLEIIKQIFYVIIIGMSSFLAVIICLLVTCVVGRYTGKSKYQVVSKTDTDNTDY